MILYAYVFACGFVVGIGVGAFQMALALVPKDKQKGIHDDDRA